MSKKDLPRYDVPNITDSFGKWLGNTSPQSASPFRGTRIRSGGNYDIDREGLQLRATVLDIQQIMWFAKNAGVSHAEAEKLLRSFSFHVLAVGADEGYADSLRNSIGEAQKALSRREFKIYDSIFGDFEIRYCTVPFRDAIYSGLCVDVPIKRLPLGNEDHLSDNLFVYGERGIARPARAFVRWLSGSR